VVGRDADRERLRRTYRSLGLGELVAAVVFTVVALRWMGLGADRATSAALWSALVPLLVILVQAGAYWLVARNWVIKGEMPSGLARLYQAFRVIDLVLLAAGLVGVLIWRPADLLGTAGDSDHLADRSGRVHQLLRDATRLPAQSVVRRGWSARHAALDARRHV